MESVTAAEMAVLRRDAARWRYIEAADLRIGRYYRDHMSECFCDFDGMDASDIDRAIMRGTGPTQP